MLRGLHTKKPVSARENLGLLASSPRLLQLLGGRSVWGLGSSQTMFRRPESVPPGDSPPPRVQCENWRFAVLLRLRGTRDHWNLQGAPVLVTEPQVSMHY